MTSIADESSPFMASTSSGSANSAMPLNPWSLMASMACALRLRAWLTNNASRSQGAAWVNHSGNWSSFTCPANKPALKRWICEGWLCLIQLGILSLINAPLGPATCTTGVPVIESLLITHSISHQETSPAPCSGGNYLPHGPVLGHVTGPFSSAEFISG